MAIDPNTLAMLTAAVHLIGGDYVKGVSSEAGKSTWSGLKQILKWDNDPKPEEISQKTAIALEQSPDLIPALVEFLKSQEAKDVGSLVGNIYVNEGGKLVVTGSITNLTM